MNSFASLSLCIADLNGTVWNKRFVLTVTFWCSREDYSIGLLQPCRNSCCHTTPRIWVQLAVFLTRTLGICFDYEQQWLPLSTLYAHARILYCDLYITGNSCREFKVGVIRSRRSHFWFVSLRVQLLFHRLTQTRNDLETNYSRTVAFY